MKKRFPAFALALLLALLSACAQAAVVPSDDPVKESYVQTDPVENDPAETDPIETVPAETDPVETAPAETDPVETDPVQSSPPQNNSSQNNSSKKDPTRSNGKPYYIKVNRAHNTVTVYGLDANGYYTVPVKAMICSVGREGHATPLGTFSLGGQWQWIHMIDDSYGQYVSQISGNYLFHSVCYYKKDYTTLITEEYNGLGAPASLGCVRLQTVDAKWIFDNCASGTRITVYDDPTSPGPLGKPDRLVDYIDPSHPASGWDPTDPRSQNPWHEILAEMAASAKPEEPGGGDVPGGETDVPVTDPGAEATPGAGPAEPGGDTDIPPVTDPDAEGTPGTDTPAAEAEPTPGAGSAEPEGENVSGGEADIPVTDPGDESAPDAQGGPGGDAEGSDSAPNA